MYSYSIDPTTSSPHQFHSPLFFAHELVFVFHSGIDTVGKQSETISVIR